MRIVQFDDLRVGAKLQVLTALTIVLISIAGAGCVKLVQTELLSARINQLRAITDTAKGIADGLQKKRHVDVERDHRRRGTEQGRRAQRFF